MDFFEFDPFDVEPLCVNCRYERSAWECSCEQRAKDKKEGKEKTGDFCPYFKCARWIEREQEEYRKQHPKD